MFPTESYRGNAVYYTGYPQDCQGLFPEFPTGICSRQLPFSLQPSPPNSGGGTETSLHSSAKLRLQPASRERRTRTALKGKEHRLQRGAVPFYPGKAGVQLQPDRRKPADGRTDTVYVRDKDLDPLGETKRPPLTISLKHKTILNSLTSCCPRPNSR